MDHTECIDIDEDPTDRYDRSCFEKDTFGFLVFKMIDINHAIYQDRDMSEKFVPGAKRSLVSEPGARKRVDLKAIVEASK